MKASFLILVVALATLPAYALAEGSHVPSWVKNTAKWWSEGRVGDADFVKGIQYLVDEGLIDIPHESEQIGPQENIPSWIKTDAGWWADGKVSDQEFLKGMGYLVDLGIIQIRGSGQFLLSSPEFADNGTIPVRFTCDGSGTPPPLDMSGIPQDAKSLALTLVDVDAPAGPYTHWVVWNIPPTGALQEPSDLTDFPQGTSSAGTVGYHGPCPPFGTHRYYFTLYALDKTLDLGQGSSRAELESAMVGHIVGKAVLMGTYSRN